MFAVSASFSPIRMISGQKDPVILYVNMKNKEEKSKLVSVIVRIPFSLGFDSVGLVRETRRRIGYIKPDTEKVIPLRIYAKPTVGEGIYPVEIKAFIHPDRYDKVEKEYATKTSLRVISR